MSKSLALILAGLLALFFAAPAMAQGLTVTKSVDNSNTANTTFNTDVTVDKDVNITIDGRTTPIPAKGSVDVSGDSIFKELDVNVQDQENVVKFFELDDSAHSSWKIDGKGTMNAAEQLQNGIGNVADIDQGISNALPPVSTDVMNVGLQYQVGDSNFASIFQRGSPIPTVVENNFAKQIQIGDGNTATITQK